MFLFMISRHLVTMKLVVVIAAIVSVCAGSVIPKDIPRNNSHYVEGESRYVWIPDDEGTLQLVDLHVPVDENVARNGADNQYWLFTRNNPNARQILRHNDINSVRNSNYRANRGLAVVVHGNNGDGNNQMNIAIRSALLAAADLNVISVDWSALANRLYNVAAAGVPGVGNHLGDFLLWLVNNAGGDWGQVHLIGFSLGAHVVGNAGRRLAGRPRRVTGLDPAGPLWHTSSNRLQNNAGRYVEAIHTDRTILGIGMQSGNTDFYPNGGTSQPGCTSRGGSMCSHSRAWDLFASSVRNPNRLMARRCDNLSQAHNNLCRGAHLTMGNTVFTKTGAGIYGLHTASFWPY